MKHSGRACMCFLNPSSDSEDETCSRNSSDGDVEVQRRHLVETPPQELGNVLVASAVAMHCNHEKKQEKERQQLKRQEREKHREAERQRERQRHAERERQRQRERERQRQKERQRQSERQRQKRKNK